MAIDLGDVNAQVANAYRNEAPTTNYVHDLIAGAGGAADYPRGLGGICNPNNHHFECRHEQHCYCGQTARVPQVGNGF